MATARQALKEEKADAVAGPAEEDATFDMSLILEERPGDVLLRCRVHNVK